MRMPPKLFADDDDDNNEPISSFELDFEHGRRLIHNRNREDLQRYEELKKRGLTNDSSDSESESEEDDVITDSKKELMFFDGLLKVKKQDPCLKNKDVKLFGSDYADVDKNNDKKKKKEKKLFLKDVQGVVEQEEVKVKVSNKSFVEEQEELRQAVFDATAMEEEEDGEDLFKEKEDEEEEEDEELAKKLDEYFVSDDPGEKFLRDYFGKQLWKEDGVKEAIDLEAEEDDEDAVEDAEEYELNYRHEENAGEVVMGHSRKVEGSVRKKDTARNVQRKNKEERLRLVEVEREEELKKLKNVKKKEIKAKMKKVFKVAGFKKGDEVKLDGKDLDDEFDPVEYDKMMKAVFDEKYYGGEDSGLSSGENDGDEKPDFDKEDELLGLPKDWEVTQGGDGFVTARELALKRKEIVDAAGDDDEKEVEGEEVDAAGDDENEVEEEEEEEEEEKVEGKRKRKRKTSLVQRAQEALMEEYYKLDYEDTIGDLKTRFKYAKVQPNRFKLETEEILCLDDSELNQFVPLKKMAPYREKDWEVNKHKIREQKLKIKELLSEKEGKHKEKRDKKKKKHSDVVADAITTKAAEEGETEESKLSRKAKRRRRQAEKKLPPNRMAAYGKTQ